MKLPLVLCLSLVLSPLGFISKAIATDIAVTDRSADQTVTIYRDQYGMPHVYAKSNFGVYFGYGYAVATDRLFQMEMLKRTARGRVAEVLGETYVTFDQKMRQEYDHRLIAQQLDQLTDKDLAILQGYAEGFNKRIDEVLQDQGALPQPFKKYDFLPSKWTAEDVAAIFIGAIAHRYADFNSERDNLRFLKAMEDRHGKDRAWQLFNSVKWLWDTNSPTTISGGAEVADGPVTRPGYLDELLPSEGTVRTVLNDKREFAGVSKDPEGRRRLEAFVTKYGFGSHPEFAPASNFWASNQLSDAKGALLNGPQFGFSMPSYAYGIGLHGGDFNVVGNTLLALPSLLFAHNGDIAWGSTAGLSDQTDEYFLRLNPQNAEQYWYQGAWRDFEHWNETIAVRNAKPVTVVARKAAQGMVVDYQPKESHAWVRARAWEGKSLDSLMAWVWLATDRSVEDAVKRIGTKVTNINMYLMDKQGRLGYVHSGRYPNRQQHHDSRLPALGDGSADWLGLRPYSDNPKIVDPENGYLVNWNNRPAAQWRSSDLWGYTWARADRAQILIDAMENTRGGTAQQLVDINREASFADVNRPFILPYLERALAENTPEDNVSHAYDKLAQWDGQWVADELGNFGFGPTVMEKWITRLQERVLKDDIGEEMWFLFAHTNYPTTAQGASIGNPVAFKAIIRQLDALQAQESIDYDLFNGAEPLTVIAETFAETVALLTQSQGADMRRWSVKAAPMEWLPVNFRGIPQAMPGNKLAVATYQNRGSENNVFIATGTGFKAMDVVPAGQGGHFLEDGKTAPHHSDQMGLYQAFEYKPLFFERDDIAAHAVSTRSLTLPELSP